MQYFGCKIDTQYWAYNINKQCHLAIFGLGIVDFKIASFVICIQKIRCHFKIQDLMILILQTTKDTCKGLFYSKRKYYIYLAKFTSQTKQVSLFQMIFFTVIKNCHANVVLTQFPLVFGC